MFGLDNSKLEERMKIGRNIKHKQRIKTIKEKLAAMSEDHTKIKALAEELSAEIHRIEESDSDDEVILHATKARALNWKLWRASDIRSYPASINDKMDEIEKDFDVSNKVG